MAAFSHITHTPAENGRRACFRGTNIRVSTVLGLLATGRSEEGILQMFPALSSADIREALAYAARRMDDPEPPQAPPSIADRQVPREDESFKSKTLSSFPRFLQPPRPPRVTPSEPKERGSQPEIPPQDTEEADPSDNEGIELYHPSHPDKPTVVLSRHGLFDRRWSTGIVAWCDIREIRRVSGEKTIGITLCNPRSYLSAMPFFKRLFAGIRLFLNLRTLYLDTASLGIRTKELEAMADRLWFRYRGDGRKKRRIRIGKSKRSFSWDDYIR